MVMKLKDHESASNGAARGHAYADVDQRQLINRQMARHAEEAKTAEAHHVPGKADAELGMQQAARAKPGSVDMQTAHENMRNAAERGHGSVQSGPRGGQYYVSPSGQKVYLGK